MSIFNLRPSRDDIKDKVSIEADLISKAAVVKLEKAGGTIQLKK
jgi:large subunit ribosomal protein L15